MTRIDRLLDLARALPQADLVTLTFEDGAQKIVSPFDALLAIIDGPRVIATDQPEGSLVWALFAGGDLLDMDDLPELQPTEDEPELPASTIDLPEPPQAAPPPDSRKGIWPMYGVYGHD